MKDIINTFEEFELILNKNKTIYSPTMFVVVLNKEQNSNTWE